MENVIWPHMARSQPRNCTFSTEKIKMLWEEKLSCLFWLLRWVPQSAEVGREMRLIEGNETTENIEKCNNKITKVSFVDTCFLSCCASSLSLRKRKIWNWRWRTTTTTCYLISTFFFSSLDSLLFSQHFYCVCPHNSQRIANVCMCGYVKWVKDLPKSYKLMKFVCCSVGKKKKKNAKMNKI